MKHSKWLKWKIGTMGAFGLALLFHEVKADPAFDKAVAKASASNNTLTDSMQSQDSVMNDFSASFSDQQNESNSQLDQGQAFNSRSHTRTGRS